MTNDNIKSDTRVRIKKMKTLGHGWSSAALKQTQFEYCRQDGSWQQETRTTFFFPGRAATIGLINLQKNTVILVKQFRLPAFLTDSTQPGHLIETPAGFINSDDVSQEEAIRRETEEETGCEITNVTQVMEVFISPSLTTERLYFFVGEYFTEFCHGSRGGVKSEGEDIQVIEILLDDAMKMIGTEIIDAKTIILLQYLWIKQLQSQL